ncbi:hypothetical protein [Risungbinella massiliensis]|uniref:hypothetical protein n=1 Tax=Risungbinella massiliensis TaxID=1329796 RepID=UPI0011CA9668|nr:hypothetical protein [Risungbinella massiliensis]
MSAEEINHTGLDNSYPEKQTSSTTQTGYPMVGQATQNQRKAIFAAGKEKGLSKEQVKQIVFFHTKKESTQDLTKQEASDLITLLNQAEQTELMNMIQTVASGNQDHVQVIENDSLDYLIDPEIEELGWL